MTSSNDLCICGASSCGGHRFFKDGDGRLIIELPAGQLARIDVDGHFWYGLHEGYRPAKKEDLPQQTPDPLAYDFWSRFATWRSILDGVFRSLL